MVPHELQRGAEHWPLASGQACLRQNFVGFKIAVFWAQFYGVREEIYFQLGKLRKGNLSNDKLINQLKFTFSYNNVEIYVND